MSLEERLHLIHDRIALLADVFELQSVAPEYLAGEMATPAACRALTELCRRSSIELRSLLDRLPAEITNWTPARGNKAIK
jgi:hypothetical protein